MSILKSAIMQFLLFIGVVNTVFSQSVLHLPFPESVAYRCTQANNDTPTHNLSITKYDLDFGVAAGSTIVASAAGIAYVYNNAGTDNGYYGGFGFHINIDHGNGNYTLYAHLSEILVPNGIFVEAGEIIAKSGGGSGMLGAGNSTSAHLHTGLHKGDPKSKIVSDSISSIYFAAPYPQEGPARYLESTGFICDESASNRNGKYYRSINVDQSKYTC